MKHECPDCGEMMESMAEMAKHMSQHNEMSQY